MQPSPHPKQFKFLQLLNDKYKNVYIASQIHNYPKLKKIFFLCTKPKYVINYFLVKFFRKDGAVLFFGKKIRIKSVLNNDSDANGIKIFGVLPSICEKKLSIFFIKHLQNSDIFYDVGANFGFYTYLALEFCEEVHSFEPLPEAFQCLVESVDVTQVPYINEYALSDHEGKASLFKKRNHSGGSSLVDKNEEFSDEIEVKISTLDIYSKEHTRPTVIKIDVEGAEELVLRGGRDTLRQCSVIIIMEIWSYEVRKSEFPRTLRAIALLLELGYFPYEITMEGGYLPYVGDFKVPTESGDSWGDNFLFMKLPHTYS